MSQVKCSWKEECDRKSFESQTIRKVYSSDDPNSFSSVKEFAFDEIREGWNILNKLSKIKTLLVSGWEIEILDSILSHLCE